MAPPRQKRQKRSLHFPATPHPSFNDPIPIKHELVPASPAESDTSVEPKVRMTNKNHSIFLESTYQMIEDGTPLAGWSDLGDSFIVYDPVKFASDQIPKYFKHAKFSSFVRQLNFYGFRKLKVDDPNWWEFQHENFVRGKKVLLKDIRRKTCTGADGINQMSREMASLKFEVKDLHQKMAAMQQKLAKMEEFNQTMAKMLEDMTQREKTKKRQLDESTTDERVAKRPHISAPLTPLRHNPFDMDTLFLEGLKNEESVSIRSHLARQVLDHLPLLHQNSLEMYLMDGPALTPMSGTFKTEDLDAAFQMETPRGFYQNGDSIKM
jgi:hypothetical protein